MEWTINKECGDGWVRARAGVGDSMLRAWQTEYGWRWRVTRHIGKYQLHVFDHDSAPVALASMEEAQRAAEEAYRVCFWAAWTMAERDGLKLKEGK